MKVGTQHGDSDDPARACRLRREQHLQPAALRENGRGVVGRGAVELRDRIASFGISLDMVPLPMSSNGDCAPRCRRSSRPEPGARSQHRRDLPDDPQLRACRHPPGEIQLHVPRRAAHRHRAGPRRRALQRVRLRRREAGSAADDRRQDRRRHVLGAHHALPRAGRAGRRGIQSQNGLPSAGSGRAEGHGLAGRRCCARIARWPEAVRCPSKRARITA